MYAANIDIVLYALWVSVDIHGCLGVSVGAWVPMSVYMCDYGYISECHGCLWMFIGMYESP